MNLFAPFISLDERTLLFTTDYAEDNVLTVYYTVKAGVDWITPKAMPDYVNSRLNFIYGYTLSPDGKTIFLSSLKSGGVGGYDILMGDFKQGGYTEMKNPGMPINSRLNDASPSLTTDGKTMYFMRCEKMSKASAENCRIYSITKNAVGQWGEATPLPSSINTGNSQFPRIMADGQTLIFSSNTMNDSKGMDLYMSHMVNGNWTDAEPLRFVNTDADDFFVSVSALGRYLLRDSPGERKHELVEYLFPPEQRPKGVLKVDGVIKDGQGNPATAYLSVTDIDSNKRILSSRPESDGTFLIYLVEGSHYQFAVDPEKSEYTYFLHPFDLTVDKPLNPENISVQLKILKTGDVFPLENVSFKPYSSELIPGTSTELSRLSRLMKATTGNSFDLQVHLDGYQEDTLQSSPDLTEIVYDSVYTVVERPDTIITYIPSIDELAAPGTNPSAAKVDTLPLPGAVTDSTVARTQVQIVMVSDTLLSVRIRYHNDRTHRQAEAIKDALVKLGVDGSRLRTSGSAKAQNDPELRMTSVRVLVQGQ